MLDGQYDRNVGECDLDEHILTGNSVVSAESVVRADRELIQAFVLTGGLVTALIMFIVYSAHDKNFGQLSPVIFIPVVHAIMQLLQNRRLFKCSNCGTILDVSPSKVAQFKPRKFMANKVVVDTRPGDKGVTVKAE